MKKYILILVILLIYACQGEKKVMHLSDGLLISNVTIISTEDGNYFPYTGYLVAEGEKIVYVGENEPNLSGTFAVIDGSEKFVIPGLIDSHVHITEVQGMLGHHMEKYPELAEDFNIQMPRSYLHNGFTTLINLGGITSLASSSAFNSTLNALITDETLRKSQGQITKSFIESNTGAVLKIMDYLGG